MSMARTCMHAHMVAHVHTRVHAKEDTYTSAHTARTRNIRIRTCATPGSTYTRHSTFQNRQPPPKAPCLVSIYHNLPTKTGLHRHISGCPSRHALADRALKPCHIQVVEKCENPRTGPAARASRAHGCCSKSDDSCAPVRVAASRVSPLHHARANFLPRGRRPRNSRVRHRHRRSLHRSLTPWVAARSAPHPSPPHALDPEHARHEHRMRRVRCTCMRP